MTETEGWVGRTGSSTSISYGDIDPDRDFYSPNDGRLFNSDDEPDDENYEDYTGNAGGG